jgi:hypothetical protein
VKHSLGNLERIVGLERVLEYELALYLCFFVFYLLLELRDLGHCTEVFGVNLCLEQVKIIDLISLIAATLLLQSHLGLSQVDALD